MSNKEQVPLPPEQRIELVELNDVECCALERGFEENVAVADSLKKSIGEAVFDSARESVAKTDQLSFARIRHNLDMEIAYKQVAVAELKRLEDGAGKTGCGRHMPDEHRDALRSVIAKLKRSVN